MSRRRPVATETINGVQYRAYRSRSEIEVLIGEGDIDDPESNVWCYPRQLYPTDAIRLASVEAHR